jgi:hypothetical protein
VSRYVEFGTEAGGPILVEVDAAEVAPAPGVEKAGLLDRRADGAVARAESSFEEAVRSAVERSVAALDDAVGSLPRAPTEVELTFALKATGEVGNIAIAKAGGEANFTVRLAWKPEMT